MMRQSISSAVVSLPPNIFFSWSVNYKTIFFVTLHSLKSAACLHCDYTWIVPLEENWPIKMVTDRNGCWSFFVKKPICESTT